MSARRPIPAGPWVLASGAMLVLLAYGPPAGASQIQIAFTGTTGSGHIAATVGADPYAGQLNGDPAGAQSITTASGTFSDSALGIGNASITGLLGLNFAPDPPGEKLLESFSFHAFDPIADPAKGFSYDNLFYDGGSPLVCLADDGSILYPFSGGFLDIFGVMFTLDSGDLLGLWSNGVMPGVGLNYGYSVIHPTTDGYKLLGSQFNGVAATAVPEPGSMWLFGTGLLGLVTWRRSVGKTRKRLQR